MPKVYSVDLRKKVIEFLLNSKVLNIAKAARTFNMNRKTVQEWLDRYNKDKNLNPNLHNGGVKPIIELDVFKKYVEDNPNKMGSEIADHFNISRTTAYSYLKKINFSLKKDFQYKEQNQELVDDYLEKLNAISKYKQVIYMDETGFDNKIYNQYGYSEKGKRVRGIRTSKKTKRINLISAIRNNELFATMIFEGTNDQNLFIEWIKKFLSPVFPKNAILILDNARYHKTKDVLKTFKEENIDVLFLPPYSPELNPIEKYWANMKRWIRNKLKNIEDPMLAINEYFSSKMNPC